MREGDGGFWLAMHPMTSALLWRHWPQPDPMLHKAEVTRLSYHVILFHSMLVEDGDIWRTRKFTCEYHEVSIFE